MIEFKKCKECTEVKHFTEFNWQTQRFSNKKDDRSAKCKKCEKRSRLLSQVKDRAKKKHLPFNLELSDIKPPEYCPVLGIKLDLDNTKMSDSSPSIDRINNKRGYTKDNIVIISMRANRIKSDASIEELCLIADFYKNISEKPKKVLDKLKNLTITILSRNV